MQSANKQRTKRRASKACWSCRSRKVRCDALDTGVPCTNCRLDQIKCVLADSHRGRRHVVAKSAAAIPGQRRSPTQFGFFDLTSLHDITVDSNRRVSLPNTTVRALEQPLAAPDLDPSHPEADEADPPGYNKTPSAAPSLTCANSHDALFEALPAFIRNTSTELDPDDIHFLQRKGAFIIPAPELRRELLRSYVHFVHPYMPVVDLEEMLSAIERNQPDSTVSLLLFQAVMFAASSFVDMQYLRNNGYDDRRAAKRDFFLRVRWLYDLNYESDHLTVLASVLLMTYRHEEPDELKNVFHWLGIGISIAQSIGLQGDPVRHPQRRRVRRVLWSCYMRDRLAALALRRSPRIHADEFRVPVLTLDDFDIEPLSEAARRLIGEDPIVTDGPLRRALAAMCIGLAELCITITKVLKVHYGKAPVDSGHGQRFTTVPSSNAADPCSIICCDQELERCYHDTIRKLLQPYDPGEWTCSAEQHDDIDLHRAVLQALYLATMSILHRPQALGPLPDGWAPEIRNISIRRVRESADHLTMLYQDLYVNDRIRYLPNSGVTCLLPATVLHISDLKRGDVALLHTAGRKFHFCMQALEQLRSIYASADFAYGILNATARKIQANKKAALSVPAPAHPDGPSRLVPLSYETHDPWLVVNSPADPGGIADKLIFVSNSPPKVDKDQERPAPARIGQPSTSNTSTYMPLPQSHLPEARSPWGPLSADASLEGHESAELANDPTGNTPFLNNEMMIDLDLMANLEGCSELFNMAYDLGGSFPI